MSNKIILARNGCKGNLHLYEQNTFIEYLQREVKEDGSILCDKVCLKILAPSTNGELAVKSYYMPEPDNVKVLIIDLLKGLMKLEKERGNLNQERIALYQYQFNKAIVDVGLKARQGVYDEDQKY